jgi:hypothetical protein
MSVPTSLRRTAAALTVTAAALSSVALVAPAASAKGGGDRVAAGGRCATGTWRLEAKPDDGRLEVEYELDTNRNGQVWSVRITDNGAQVFAGRRTTAAPSGSFGVQVRPKNRAGADKVVVTAKRGSVTCTGSVRL